MYEHNRHFIGHSNRGADGWAKNQLGAHLLYDSITSFDFLLFHTFRPTV